MDKKEYLNYRILNFSIFFGGGAFFAYVGKYLDSIHFTGTEIGIIISLGALISIFVQPIWGYMSDKTGEYKKILMFLIVMLSFLEISLSVFKDFKMAMLMFFIFYLFNCGMGPIFDTVLSTAKYDYGKMRLWGSVGFAVGVFFTGIMIDLTNIYAIFVVFPMFYVISFYILRKIDVKGAKPQDNIDYHDILLLLKNKKYILFLLSSFFIMGTMYANNTYFSIFYEKIGGEVAGTGFAFLLFALSEVPFMSKSNEIIKRIGSEGALVLAASSFFIRWIVYSLMPSPIIIIATFFLQGLSIGLYIVVAINYIKENTAKERRTMALALYSVSTGGFSAMFFQFIAGFIYEKYGIGKSYLLMGISVLIGIFILIYMHFVEKKRVAG
ncbi:MFS transporter [Haliovirga abyssi]|uniref:Transporter YwbF n=1 Tax=Haliovirga abyssi TaxID=2996794 RepID=A0AAU9DD28_9FUSO|nr:MFS transporter [Haliovirga abyssi]BDU51426.1 putative transporter YwbF [Haliovirga abyssi]